MNYSGNGIIIDTEKRILLLKRSNYSKVFPMCWTIPGGRSDPGESPKETTKREVFEETGLFFTPEKNFSLTYREIYDSTYETYKFLGEYSGDLQIDTKEADGYGWFTYIETQDLKLAFEDSDTITKLYKVGLIV